VERAVALRPRLGLEAFLDGQDGAAVDHREALGGIRAGREVPVRQMGACGDDDREAVTRAHAVRPGGRGPHEREGHESKADRDDPARLPHRSHAPLTREPPEKVPQD
jgi:hypothetical protein